MDGRRSALELWREKLEHLLAEEAIASDPEKKFQLRIQIREAQQKITELEKSRRFPDHSQSGGGSHFCADFGVEPSSCRHSVTCRACRSNPNLVTSGLAFASPSVA